MKRTGFAKVECPVGRALDAIGDWWSLLIVRDAFDGLRRFGDFQTNLGIAKGMLSARLRKLVQLGVLELVPASDGSAYQEYALTRKGRDLFPVVVSLRQWGEAHLFARGEAHSDLVDQTGQPVGQLVLPSRTGRPLTWSDTRVRKVGARKR
ncbi:helix-turn-helix transcriptional regulator [Bradyrhizobium japonicum]|uniref:winged helix-turn-helix transcriptional regulator n=1 Tax=Bradyrhizobium japonicum TaxID=375 RepID=UPI001BAD6BED|nr:helix-turn-helix domain-containing protein [Bradyrhizobium japonicum]MBR0742628.1 helix-turn-helix transcriptional regulator [Bradyrhizobium japonicum]